MTQRRTSPPSVACPSAYRSLAATQGLLPSQATRATVAQGGVLENVSREAPAEEKSKEKGVLSSGRRCDPGIAPIADRRDLGRRSEENRHDATPRCRGPRCDPLVPRIDSDRATAPA